MKLIIEQTGDDGRTKYVERVASCRPEGQLSMTGDVFEDAISEMKWDVDHMKEGEAKMEAFLRFADCCVENSDYGMALDYYATVLKKSVSDDKIIKGRREMAERAYQGVVVCNSYGDEPTWEDSSELTSIYQHLFQKEK